VYKSHAPVLWERTAPRGPAQADWSWPDARIARLCQLGVRPIVGLLHHGTGPEDTSLLDEAMPRRLAEFAGAVARRYPWVDAFTPVNEPLTTARFCALYGHWYPHAADDRSFALALLNEIEGVVRSMEAIRTVTPGARLVQTEDLGFVHSTPTLAYQAEFENERRWISFDLLCGTVDRHHPIGAFLLRSGVSEDRLAWFRDHPCPPDIVGVNYYVTSERFLDDRSATPGPGNGRHRYDDVAAVRTCGMRGLGALLDDTWARFHRPIAITEAHLGCTREEQLRWLMTIWDAAEAARSRGDDVRAVTVWALLGAYDWDSLCTQARGRYESGVFDVRGPTRRPTALAGVVRSLAAGMRPQHPALHGRGWWQR
jgi:dTDP-4-dehydrorhamnose reductase